MAIILFLMSFGMLADGRLAAAKKAVSLKKTKVSMEVGDSYKLVVKNAPKKSVITYKSGKKSVATVSKKGVIKAKNTGSCKITVRVWKKTGKKKSLVKKLTCKVTVYKMIGPEPTSSPFPTPVVSQKFVGDKKAALSDTFVDQVSDFSLNLFKASCEEKVKIGKNTLVSPQSVLTDVMMAAGGAETSTKAEMEKTMCGTVGFTDFRKSLSDLNARLLYSDPVRFYIANSIWILDDAERLQVKPEFLEDGEKWYNATSRVLPFDQAMVKAVNDWVKENTFGMIPELLKEPPKEDDVMHLINALAFEASWAEQYIDFQVTPDATFTNAKGEKKKVNMLNETIRYYLHDDKAIGFEKYYQGYDYKLVTILPNEGVSVSDYLNTMDGASFRDYLKSAVSGYMVHTSMPEFTYDFDTSLNDSLKAMGIREAFSADADFSGMADTRTGKLFIGNVTHKTHIELDRKGTKAAAVTDIGMADGTSVEPDPQKEITIRLDRPFIYAIVHNETGIPVFIGTANDVGE